MQWDAIGAIAELVGALAVLATLGYLAVQIRQGTRELRAAALTSLRDTHLLTEHNDEYNALLMKHQRKEPLSNEERILMVERFYTIMKTFERIWLQYQLGGIPRSQFDQHLDLMRWALTLKVCRKMWAQLASTFTADFCAVIDEEVLAENAPGSQMNKAFLILGSDP